MSQANTSGSEKAGRNDPCPCGSGKKFKKCCGFTTQPVVQAAPPVLSPEEALVEARSKLDVQLAKYAPTVTVDDVETKIREAQKNAVSGPKTAPMQVIESVFSDDNLMLKNKRHADRLFRAFMSLWNTIAETEKN